MIDAHFLLLSMPKGCTSFFSRAHMQSYSHTHAHSRLTLSSLTSHTSAQPLCLFCLWWRDSSLARVNVCETTQRICVCVCVCVCLLMIKSKCKYVCMCNYKTKIQQFKNNWDSGFNFMGFLFLSVSHFKFNLVCFINRKNCEFDLSRS